MEDAREELENILAADELRRAHILFLRTTRKRTSQTPCTSQKLLRSWACRASGIASGRLYPHVQQTVMASTRVSIGCTKLDVSNGECVAEVSATASDSCTGPNMTVRFKLYFCRHYLLLRVLL